MFAQHLKKESFYKKYIKLLAMRQAIANLQMEDAKMEMLDPTRIQEMYNNIAAFEYILKAKPKKITPYNLIDIADLVNKDIGYYAKGFRKTQVDVNKAKNFSPIPAKDIQYKIYSTFDAYHNIWKDLPIYEKEAKFHIELVRTQPFEDGNKRSTRILTNYNLCYQNKAPVIIPAKDTDKYFGFIDDYAVDDMAKFLKEKSEEELEVMLTLYSNICGETFDNNEEDLNIHNLDNEKVDTLLKEKTIGTIK